MLVKVARNMLAKVVLVAVMASYSYHSIGANYFDTDSCPVNDCTLVPQLCHLKRNVSELTNRTKNIQTNVSELFARGRKFDEDVNKIRNSERSLKIRVAKLEKENSTLKQELQLLKETKVLNLEKENSDLKIRVAELEKENSTLKQGLQLLKETKVLNLTKENSDLKIQIQSMKKRQETNEAAFRKLTDVTLAILRNQTLFNKAENMQQQKEIENIRSQLENRRDVKNSASKEKGKEHPTISEIVTITLGVLIIQLC